MKYIRLEKNIVTEIIPEFDPTFPNVPIEARYPAEFRRGLIEVEDEVKVCVGMVYDADGGTFAYPEPIAPVEPEPQNLDEAKESKIAESKVKLAEWLNNNPMQYTDGKFYSVTAEKQSLLNNNLTSYERAVEAGIEYPLKWNATGEECEEWDYPDLVALSLAIAGYVAPQVSKQQALEIKINACTTVEELDKVVIYYG